VSRTCTTEGLDPSIVTEELTLADGGPNTICAIRPDLTSGHIVSALGLSGTRYSSYEVHMFYDGKKLVMYHGQSVLVATSLEVAGPNIPFCASFRMYGTRYRKNSERPIISFRGESVVLIADTNLGGENTSLRRRPIVDFGEILQVKYELRVPYKHLRKFVKEHNSVICYFAPGGFGFYNQNGDPLTFPSTDIRYHANSENPRVIHITEKDVLNHLTRAQGRGSEPAFIGVGAYPGGTTIALKRIIGKESDVFWSRTAIGDVDVARYQVGPHFNILPTPPELFQVNANTVRYTPRFGDLKAGDWTIPIEEEEMNEEQKKIVRAWWHAYIAQKARLGEEISPEDQEVADNVLS